MTTSKPVVIKDEDDIQQITTWMNDSDALKELKEREMNLRKEIADKYCESQEDEVELIFDFVDADGDGLMARVKVKKSLANKFKLNKSAYAQLSPEAKSCINIDYKLDKRRYNEQDEEVQKELIDFITSSPSSPTISFELE